MTQEEKAKAYDEALKKIKVLQEDWKSTHNRAWKEIEEVFPQLAESEDERIRKRLIEIVGLYYGTSAIDPERDEVLAWLEKQKEQKPILEVFGFKVGDAVRLKDGDGRKHIIKSFEEVEGIHGPNFYHVEFEDGSARDGIYPGEEYPNGYYTQMEKFEEEQKPVDYEAELKKCKENPLYFYDKYVKIKQKPAERFEGAREKYQVEWGEEDEKIVNNIVSVLGQYIDYKAVSGTGSGYATPRYAKEIDWLNSLRTTNQGWGEEDEEMRKLLIAILEVNHPDGFFKANELGTTDMRGVHTEEIISWLKSLRPSWKPSPDKSLEEEVKNYFQGYWPGTETVEQCNTDLHFTPPAIIRLARHFAEWQYQKDREEFAKIKSTVTRFA